MKTKYLLALAVAGLATPVAFGAVSSNIVGYTTLNLAKGYNLVCNTLNNKSGNGLVNLLDASVPSGTSVFRWSGSGFTSFNKIDAGLWDGDYTLNPGEAVFIQVPAATPVTLIGEVLTGTQTLNLVKGYNFVSSVIPKAGALDTDLGYAPKDGDAVFAWSGNGYSSFNYIGGVGWDTTPTLTIGQGIIIQTSAGSWTQTFTPPAN